jgi:FMN reductase
VTALAVISGGLREPSSTRLLAGQIDAAVRAELAQSGLPAVSSFVELRPLGRAIMDAMLTGFAGRELESAFETVAANASFSGLFKSFFDVLPEHTLSDMPVLIAATGGTERHSLVLEHALRPMFS